MFQILSQIREFHASKLTYHIFIELAFGSKGTETENPSLQTISEGQRLVRIPIEELRQGNTENQS